MDQPLFGAGDFPVSVGEALAALGAAALVLLVVLLILVARAARARGREADTEAGRAREVEERLEALTRIQAETIGGLRSMSDSLTGRQAELARVVSDSLAAVTHRLDQSMASSTQQTMERLHKLNERLAVIDNAQKNLTDLSSQVTSLREVLANKQARGAFGQARMEAIVQDGLPKGAYEFQFTLSNRTRPDCVVFLPGDKCPLVIDAKFPLEAITALRDAKTDEVRKQAAQRLRVDVLKHVADISARYLIPGETQELALMFVPAESVYAELHDGFDDVIQKAYRAQVVLVSPSLLMLAIQVMQQICKDARMRDAVTEIRTEVGHLMGDIERLRDRVLKLQQHFGRANEDVGQILISADKIVKRGGRIESLEFEGEEAPREARAAMPAPLARRMTAAE
jgi:DNA recombination protein RmuC